MRRRPPAWFCAFAFCALACSGSTARAASEPAGGDTNAVEAGRPPASTVARTDDSIPAAAATPSPGSAPAADGLDHLVPELANHAYHLNPGVRPYRDRLSVTPGYGRLGGERLFALHVAYNPNEWLGYEASIEHNPGEAVHAVLHSLNVVLRHPLAGRFQPYLTGGYGMITVHPGRSLNADPVSKNFLSFGGGLEFFIRDDLAIRGDIQRATVFGRERDRDGVVAYDYLQQTIGLCFYRTIAP